MALLRIAGCRGGCPSIEEIRRDILKTFLPRDDGWHVEEVLNWAMHRYPPLRFVEVGEEGAREAVLRRRPVLTTFHLSHSGWKAFSQHFESKDTHKSVLTRDSMAPHRELPDDGGHAVVLHKCDPHSLTFLNSWGKQWGDKGTFSVEDHSVLELDGASEQASV